MSIGSVFSNMVRSDAFKGTLAAVGIAAAGELGARLGNIATARGYEPSGAAETGGGVPPASGFAGFGFGTIPWGPVVLVGGIGALIYFVTRKRKGRE